MVEFNVIGKQSLGINSLELVTGRAKFVGDLFFPDMLIGKILYSPVPCARIKKIDIEKARSLPGVIVILLKADIPGEKNYIYEDNDQPLLVDDKIRYQGDALAAIAAENEDAACAAMEAIEIDYEILPGIYDPFEAIKPESPRVWPERNNIYKQLEIMSGDIKKGFEQSDIVIENVYSTPYHEHAFMEPEGASAKKESDGSITVYSSTQYPFSDRMQIARSLAVPESMVRVITPYIGGAFGGKDEAHVQIHAALLSQVTGRPVRILRTREESIRVHVKRHPFTIRYRSGITADGKLKAIHVEAITDTGPYANSAGSLIASVANCVSGPYYVPNARIEAYAVNTNNPICGALRGFGMPQANFACELQMDVLAKAAGIDPLDIRLANGLEKGRKLVTGVKPADVRGMKASLKKAAKLSGWYHQDLKKKQSAPYLRRGWGIATAIMVFLYPRGARDNAGIWLDMSADGSVLIRTGGVDFGQGLHTALAHLVAERLGVKLSSIRVLLPDTDRSVDAGSSVCSRQTFVSGNAVLVAAGKIRKILLEIAEEETGISKALLDLKDGFLYAEGEKLNYSVPDLSKKAIAKNMQLSALGFYAVKFPEGTFDENSYPDASGAFTFCTQVAKVLVDIETGEVKVEELFVVTDAGKIIHSNGALGQSEGGAAMGFGQTVMEELLVKKGHTLTDSLGTYLIPTAKDMPRMKCDFLEFPQSEGPYGAKGIAEAAVIPTAAAILNAVRNATGVDLKEIPITAERVLRALNKMKNSTL